MEGDARELSISGWSASTAEGVSAAERTMEYLADLVKEKRQLGMFPQLFPNMERLIDEGYS